MLTGLFKDIRFGPLFLSIYTRVFFIGGSLSIWTVLGYEILAHIKCLFSRKFSRV